MSSGGVVGLICHKPFSSESRILREVRDHHQADSHTACHKTLATKKGRGSTCMSQEASKRSVNVAEISHLITIDSGFVEHPSRVGLG